MNKKRIERIKKKKMLQIWSKAIRKRDQHCVICGRTDYLQAHHIISKDFEESRLWLINGITLCPKHHKFGKFSAHKNGLYFITWLEKNREEQYRILKEEIWKLVSKSPYY